MENIDDIRTAYKYVAQVAQDFTAGKSESSVRVAMAAYTNNQLALIGGAINELEKARAELSKPIQPSV